MPAIQTTCPGCRARLRCPAATRAGKLILCPRCGTGFEFGWLPRAQRQPPAGARGDWSAVLVLVIGGLLVTLAVAAVGVATLLLSGR
jgi:hypothetical protein